VESVTLNKFLKKTSSLDRLLFIIILIGAIVAIVSLFRGILMDAPVQVEYLAGGNLERSEPNSKVFVDIEGAVMKQGVYELLDGSRIKDVLIMAG